MNFLSAKIFIFLFPFRPDAEFNPESKSMLKYAVFSVLILTGCGFYSLKGEYPLPDNVEWLIEPQYESVMEFREGLAIVKSTEENGYVNGYITKKNRMVIGSKHYHSMQHSRNGVIEFSEHSIIYRLTKLGDSNKIIKQNIWNDEPFKKDETEYPFFKPFYVKGKGGGYRDASGKIIIKPGSISCWAECSEGLAMVCIKDKRGTILAGFIDVTGTFVIKPRYIQPSTYGFHEGLCAFMDKTTEKWGYMDKNGNTVIKPVFDNAYDFTEGCAGVEVNRKWGFIKNPLRKK